MGCIVIWSTNSAIPEEYLECNGQYINSTLYPKLAALMSNTPDYRGVFLRGLGSITSTHFNTVIHSSDSLGVLQGDAIRNVTGKTGYWNDDNGTYSSGALFLSHTGNVGQAGGSGEQWLINLDASRVVPTANENRPINKAVLYLIKAK